jgi:hypothetical protein
MSHSQGDTKGKTAYHKDLGVFGIEISVVDPQEVENPQETIHLFQYGGGIITSALKEQFMPSPEEFGDEGPIFTAKEREEAVAKASADALESFLLALACEGIDVKSPAVLCALETSVAAIAERL